LARRGDAAGWPIGGIFDLNCLKTSSIDPGFRRRGIAHHDLAAYKKLSELQRVYPQKQPLALAPKTRSGAATTMKSPARKSRHQTIRFDAPRPRLS
jgi:hypothetical protein